MVLIGMELTIMIYDAYSLKDKRSVVKSILHKLKNQYNVSVAEVDEMDIWNKAILGIGIVGNNRVLCEKILQKVIQFIENNYEVEVTEIDWQKY
ncbi:DUF503 domain-containing protein [Marinilactibacillus psychrotolerans]|uniref:DUF503 domain-containing protein n=1 Tax=Marinilactibacillus psychrotolerans TaxID=191770 RepID=UPI0018677F55|nr:DUF503 domain-containing protein [Marinilactibacillus psychrotolerans]